MAGRTFVDKLQNSTRAGSTRKETESQRAPPRPAKYARGTWRKRRTDISGTATLPSHPAASRRRRAPSSVQPARRTPHSPYHPAGRLSFSALALPLWPASGPCTRAPRRSPAWLLCRLHMPASRMPGLCPPSQHRPPRSKSTLSADHTRYLLSSAPLLRPSVPSARKTASLSDGLQTDVCARTTHCRRILLRCCLRCDQYITRIYELKTTHPCISRLLSLRQVRPRIGIVCSITTRTVHRNRSSLHVRTIILFNIHHVPLTARRVAQFVSRVKDGLAQHGPQLFAALLCPVAPLSRPQSLWPTPSSAHRRLEARAHCANRTAAALILLTDQRARDSAFAIAPLRTLLRLLRLLSPHTRVATRHFWAGSNQPPRLPNAALANRNARPQYDTTSTICSRQRKPPPRRE